MKNNSLPLIALQLSHPDAFFYEVQANAESVFGLFEAHEKGQPFSVSLESFLWAAQRLNFIGDYDQKMSRVWVSDGYEGAECDAVAWVCQMVEFGGQDTQDTLKDAVRADFEAELTRLAREIASGATSHSVPKRIFRTVDADFCNAIEKLAGIIRAANMEPI